MGDADHRHAVPGQTDHRVEDFLDHFRIKCAGRLIEQHRLGLHAERPRDGNALLLAARKLGRDICRPGREFGRAQDICGRVFSASALLVPRTRIGASVQFSSIGHVRKQVEALEHHADFAPDGIDRLGAVIELCPLDDDRALLDLLEALMQRISVDLPDPDGPQSTIFSPLRTVRLMFFNAWNAPYHLSTAFIEISGLLSVSGVRHGDLLLKCLESVDGEGDVRNGSRETSEPPRFIHFA